MTVILDILRKYWYYAAIALAVIFLFVYLGASKSCQGRQDRLTRQQTADLQKALETGDRKELDRIFVEAEVKDKAINENVANARAETQTAIKDAKQRASQMTNDQIAEELNRRAQEQ